MGDCPDLSDPWYKKTMNPVKSINQPSRPDSPPAPVKPDPKPAPSPRPDRSPAPGRPSPRPGERPGPVTDPKNYLERLSDEYYHTLPADLKKVFSDTNPVRFAQKVNLLESRILKDREETTRRREAIQDRWKERELPDRILKLQKGLEGPIQAIIHDYLEEIAGPLYHRNRENLDLSWKDPYDLKTEKERPFLQESRRDRPGNTSDENRDRESRGETGEDSGKKNEIDRDYLKDTMLRSEFYYQMIQGFGILYMDGFFRMHRKEIDALQPELSRRYEEYHLNGHFVHHLVFQDVMEGKTLPPGIDAKMEKEKSQGRVWHTTDPMVDETTGNVTGIRSVAHARSRFGIILVHEALKGLFQLLTPWARLHENYLRPAELDLHRMALNSYWAEIRQFAMGPSLFLQLQSLLDRLEIPSFASSDFLYRAIENIALAPREKFALWMKHILEETTPEGSDRKEGIRSLLEDPARPGETNRN